MRCYICGKPTVIKRTIKTLFKTEPVYKCPSCRRKYPIFINEQIIPKENGIFHIYSFFIEENDVNWLSLNKEVSYWFYKILQKKKKNDLILWLDEIDLDIIELLDLMNDNVYVLIKTVLDI